MSLLRGALLSEPDTVWNAAERISSAERISCVRVCVCTVCEACCWVDRSMLISLTPRPRVRALRALPRLWRVSVVQRRAAGGEGGDHRCAGKPPRGENREGVPRQWLKAQVKHTRVREREKERFPDQKHIKLKQLKEAFVRCFFVISVYMYIYKREKEELPFRCVRLLCVCVCWCGCMRGLLGSSSSPGD